MRFTIKTQPVPLALDDEGVIRVGGTRITLDTIVYAFLEGATAEELVQQYPSLSLSDIYSVIGYYLSRKEEVDSYLQQREQVRKRIEQQNEKRFAPTGIRAKLLARRLSQSS
ncbi:MAG: DUF433 domain-containing protein [Chloroflexi bacterium]|nr:DUF433 domain-containing protein [Chloroflexota bacterium]